MPARRECGQWPTQSGPLRYARRFGRPNTGPVVWANPSPYTSLFVDKFWPGHRQACLYKKWYLAKGSRGVRIGKFIWGIIWSPKMMILQGVKHPMSYSGVCCTNTPKSRGYVQPA